MANHRMIISRANELGHSPTAMQAHRISRLLADEHRVWMEKVRGLRGTIVDDRLFALCWDWAIRVEMGGRPVIADSDVIFGRREHGDLK